MRECCSGERSLQRGLACCNFLMRIGLSSPGSRAAGRERGLAEPAWLIVRDVADRSPLARFALSSMQPLPRGFAYPNLLRRPRFARRNRIHFNRKGLRFCAGAIVNTRRPRHVVFFRIPTLL